jgi:hypothetical protein
MPIAFLVFVVMVLGVAGGAGVAIALHHRPIFKLVPGKYLF